MDAAARQDASLTLTFEGRRLAAVPGETVAATLAAHGILTQSTGKDGAPRGLYCGMGVCHDCLVKIDGRGSQRACLAKAAEGMRVERQEAGRVPIAPKQDAGADLTDVPDGDAPLRRVDIAIVGAGPGGLAAAEIAAAAGANVLILDERPAPGGQFYKQPSAAAARRRAPDRQAGDGAALIGRVRALGVTLEAGTLVWGAERDDEGMALMTLADGRAATVRPRILIVATGAFERPLVVPGWTLPGVMTTGAAQTLLRSYGVAPGRRLVIAGNGPLNLQVAAELGGLAERVTIAEAAPAPWTRPGAAAALLAADRRLGLWGMAAVARLVAAGRAVHWGHRLIAVEGGAKAERAILAPLDSLGRVLRDRAFAVEADAVLTGDGFRPAAELPRLLGCRHRLTLEGGAQAVVERGDDGATSLDDIFVVGEAGGFGGAQIALAQGRLAGAEAARRLGFRAADTGDARRHLAHHRRFQAALWRLFAAPDPGLDLATGDTILCRCEALTLGALKAEVTRHHIADLASLKRLTRAGMGRCQGRYCTPNLAALIGPAASAGELDLPAPQMPLRPVPMTALAREQPEWGGHRRTLLPADRAPTEAPPLPATEVATLVIGAGIVGLSTALFLARAGHPVMAIDRGHPNGGASGGNAGSLHAQLLSFDHGARAEAGGGPAACTLPLQADSIRLWQQLERELGADLELKITGGLMVAESARDLAFLEAKTAVERAQGVDCRVIGQAELRTLEPALDERFLGAAYCPSEGKINPLVATQAILEAAVAAGALVAPETLVTAITRTGAGFTVETSRGPIRAGRIVNAAGAFAGRIGAMAGIDVPVFGAPLQMIVTEAAQPLVGCLVAHADRHLTLKQAANGNIIIGGGWTAGLDPVHVHPRPLRASLEGNLWVAQHVVPALRRLHVLRSWAAMNINIDGAPILGAHPAVPGFFNAVTSNGYTLGPVMGQTTAELILHGRAGRDVSAFGIARFGTQGYAP